jgi:hypothetical protein
VSLLQPSATSTPWPIATASTFTKIELAEGIAAARAIYGQQYNPVLTLRAVLRRAQLRGSVE